jgi:hypothetical protein
VGGPHDADFSVVDGAEAGESHIDGGRLASITEVD